LVLLGLNVVIMFEDNKEEIKSILEKQANPKHKDAMGEKNN